MEPQSPPYELSRHVDWLRALSSHPDESLRNFFEPGGPICVARAPGRLDVMGGIADYSGSLVLEMPIRESAFVAIQIVREPGVVVATVDNHDNVRRVHFSGADWQQAVKREYAAFGEQLRQNPHNGWVAYVLGPILVLLREASAEFQGGLRILVRSHVPEGKSVSSSAAVEVATMRAAAALDGIDMEGRRIAQLCQRAENLVVGAPCGIMDQMTAALGHEDALLALRCQPDIVEGFIRIPKEIGFWGIDSGIRHAVSGIDYTSVRVGTFMGYRIIANAAGLKVRPASDVAGVVEVDDAKWRGYLSNITPEEFGERFSSRVPVEISGREFLNRYGGTTDRVTRVDPQWTYAVRQPTLHPIEENARVGRFGDLLRGEMNERALAEMGELMFASHASYSACGLGSDSTDLLVQLVHEAGPAAGLYGAKITGGGSGGTVVVLGRAGAESAVDAVALQYREISGRPAYVFRGSSPGACATEIIEARIS